MQDFRAELAEMAYINVKHRAKSVAEPQAPIASIHCLVSV